MIRRCRNLLHCLLTRLCALEFPMPRKSPLAARKKTTTIDSSKLGLQGLNCGNEISVERHIPAGHARRVEGHAGIAVTVEKNQASRPMRPLGEEVNGFPR